MTAPSTMEPEALIDAAGRRIPPLQVSPPNFLEVLGTGTSYFFCCPCPPGCRMLLCDVLSSSLPVCLLAPLCPPSFLSFVALTLPPLPVMAFPAATPPPSFLCHCWPLHRCFLVIPPSLMLVYCCCCCARMVCPLSCLPSSSSSLPPLLHRQQGCARLLWISASLQPRGQQQL